MPWFHRELLAGAISWQPAIGCSDIQEFCCRCEATWQQAEIPGRTVQPEQNWVLKKTLSSSFLSESPQPLLSTTQILSMFPTQPVGGSPYSSPPYSPTAMPWGQQGPLGNQWAGPALAPWPTMPGNVTAAWAPPGVAAPPAGGQVQAPSYQPGVMMGGNTPTSPTTVNGYLTPLNSYAPAGATGPLQSMSSALDHNPLLWWTG